LYLLPVFYAGKSVVVHDNNDCAVLFVGKLFLLILPRIVLLQKVCVFVHRWILLMIDVSRIQFGIISLIVYTTARSVSLVSYTGSWSVGCQMCKWEVWKSFRRKQKVCIILCSSQCTTVYYTGRMYSLTLTLLLTCYLKNKFFPIHFFWASWTWKHCKTKHERGSVDIT
jgi:hypothetical protein